MKRAYLCLVFGAMLILLGIAPSAFASWSFATLSDTYSGLEWGMTQRAAQLYNHHNNISFIVSTGDFENHSTISNQFQTTLSGYYPGYSNIPWFGVFGNHNVDISSDSDDFLNVLTVNRIQTQLPGMTNFRMGPHNSGMTYAREGTTYSFNYGDAHFIMLNQFYATDTAMDGHDNGSPTACVYDQWYDWLVEDLAQNTKPLIFIFGHEPAFPRGSNHCGDSLDEDACPGNYLTWNNPARPQREKFWQLLNSYNVVSHFVGHEHLASARVIKELNDFPGITCTSQNTCYCDDPDWNCYCNAEPNLSEISNGEIINPSQGVIEYNDGISRNNGDFHVIEVDENSVKFYMYKDVGGIVTLVRSFTYDATSLFSGITVYVDPSIESNNCNNYSADTRSCGAGNKTAYKNLNDASGAVNPGDRIIIRESIMTERIIAQKSGTEGNPITFEAYPGESVKITLAQNGVPGIEITNKQYLTFDGLEVGNVWEWGQILNSNHIIFQNMIFSDARDTGTRGSLRFINSNYNKILDSVFESGNDSLFFENSNNNLAEGNTFHDARHTLLVIACSNNNVIRNNTFYNSLEKGGETFDCEGVVESLYDDTRQVERLDATKRNIWEDNIFSYTPPDLDDGGPYNGIQYAGQNGIIRRNIFYGSNGIGLGMAHYSTEALNNKYNRVYNNVFYNNRGGGIEVSQNMLDNIFKNNIFYKNIAAPLGWADDTMGGSQISHRSLSGYKFDHNALFDNSIDDPIIYANGSLRTLGYMEASFPALYDNNVETDPEFVNPAGYDFSLSSASPLINQGDFLATATGSGTSNLLPVNDVSYFYDGYGIAGEDGDLIRLANQSETARVVDIDYDNNILTLDKSLSWTSGQGVSLSYYGSKPDMGAFEYFNHDALVPIAPSGLNVL